MRYLLIHCVAEDGRPRAGAGPEIEASLSAWVQEITSRGISLEGDRLGPSSQAKTVRVRGGEVLVGDGPFAETKEQVAGYDLIECADLRQAVDVAFRHPTARVGAIEIRPVETG